LETGRHDELVTKRRVALVASGFLLGVLNMAAFFTADYYLSVSTTFSRAAGTAVSLIAPEHVAANAYGRRSSRFSTVSSCLFWASRSVPIWPRAYF
jgi:hypothetical protein